MTWPKFLELIREQNALTLIGPLLGHEFTPHQATIFVDGGQNFRASSPSVFTDIPCVSVGDGDSSRNTLEEILPREKDFSDLAFCLRNLPASVQNLELRGFLGGRRDHELANLGEVHAFLKTRDGRAQFDDAVFAFAGGVFKREIHGTFSLMVLERASLSVRGACDYRAEKLELGPASSHGLSNVGHGVVEIASTLPVFIFTGSSTSDTD